MFEYIIEANERYIKYLNAKSMTCVDHIEIVDSINSTCRQIGKHEYYIRHVIKVKLYCVNYAYVSIISPRIKYIFQVNAESSNDFYYRVCKFFNEGNDIVFASDLVSHEHQNRFLTVTLEGGRHNRSLLGVPGVYAIEVVGRYEELPSFRKRNWNNEIKL